MNTNTPNTPVPVDDSKESRVFEKLVMWVSSLSIAVMAGFLASLKQVNPAIRLQFSTLTVVAFILAGAITALFLRIVLHGNKRHRAFLVVAAAVLAMLGYFLIGLRNASPENRRDMFIGTVAAVLVLSGVGFVLWKLGRYFESDKPDRK